MTIGLMPNIQKENILNVLNEIWDKLNENGFNILISRDILTFLSKLPEYMKTSICHDNNDFGNRSDIVISIGGDGTMLYTAHLLKDFDTPLAGLNFGKLGFLAEYESNNLLELIEDIKNKTYFIDERIALEGVTNEDSNNKLYALNDLVIDKGRWPKMITLTIKVDDDYVSTFSADGLIISTPTGSTGYSLSAGGPIVNPLADVILINPISPHTLTMRPLVLSSKQKINISVESYSDIQINCDGQRVFTYHPPIEVEIKKASKPFKLLHTNKKNYFQILRNKLFWGLDVRNNK